ncbi:MAG: DUF983 domain-containing protein [Chitinophagaceae bacterium]|nr:DUF983 domain-containing protein [Chitinophagaceae bacterium]
MILHKKPRPNLLWSILTMRCPKCRRGNLFTHTNPFRKLSLSYMLDMPVSCPVCKQKFDLEPGFWYGTGYVSYGLAVLISAITFIAWWIIIGISINDNRVFYWLGFNAVLILVIQPWLMQFSRAVYIYFFIRYDEHYENSASNELHLDEK